MNKESDVVDLDQNTYPLGYLTEEDVLGILCDSGDLLRECHEALMASGDVELADGVRVFCERVHESMVSGTPYRRGR